MPPRAAVAAVILHTFVGSNGYKKTVNIPVNGQQQKGNYRTHKNRTQNSPQRAQEQVEEFLRDWVKPVLRCRAGVLNRDDIDLNVK